MPWTKLPILQSPQNRGKIFKNFEKVVESSIKTLFLEQKHKTAVKGDYTIINNYKNL